MFNSVQQIASGMQVTVQPVGALDGIFSLNACRSSGRMLKLYERLCELMPQKNIGKRL